MADTNDNPGPVTDAHAMRPLENAEKQLRKHCCDVMEQHGINPDRSADAIKQGQEVPVAVRCIVGLWQQLGELADLIRRMQRNTDHKGEGL